MATARRASARTWDARLFGSAATAIIAAIALAPFAAQAKQVSVQFAKNSGIKMEDQIFIGLCASNPSAVGCVKRAKKCRDTKGSWQGYDGKVCAALLSKAYGPKTAPSTSKPAPKPAPPAARPRPAAGSGGLGSSGSGGMSITGGQGSNLSGARRATPRRRKKVRLTENQKWKIRILACKKRPDLPFCRELKGLCYRKFRTANARARNACRQLGWVPRRSQPKRNTLVQHRNFSLRLMGYDDNHKVFFDEKTKKAQNGLAIVRAQKGALDRKDHIALDLDIQLGGEMGDGESKLLFDASIAGGFGFWSGDSFGLAVLGGVGYGGLQDRAPATLMWIAESLLITHPTRETSVVLRGKAVWMGDEKHVRKRGSETLSFCDEFIIQAHVYYGSKPSAYRNRDSNEWFFGVEMREWLGSRMYGLTLGLGYSQN